jgi:hypothetical protein
LRIHSWGPRLGAGRSGDPPHAAGEAEHAGGAFRLLSPSTSSIEVRVRYSPITASAFLLLLSASPAFAQWATGGARINTASQNAPAFVGDGAGGVRDFSVVDAEIVGSGITVDGTRTWCTTYGQDSYPNAITGVGDGLKTQLLAADDGVGGDVLAWFDTRKSGAGMYVQRVDAAGTPLWTLNGVLVRVSNKDGAETALCGDGAGGAFFAFQPRVPGITPTYPVMLQHVGSDGALTFGTGISISDQTGSNSREIRMVPDGSGGVVVCWVELALDGSGRILAQRVDGRGARQWGPVGVGVESIASVSPRDVRIIADGTGGVFVTWNDYRLGYLNVNADRVNGRGLGQWLAGTGVQVTANPSYHAALARDPATGDVFYAYIRPGILGGPSYLSYARLTGAGASVWTEHSVGNPGCDSVAVAADGIGGLVLAYHDIYLGTWAEHVASDLTRSFYGLLQPTLPAETPFAVPDGRGGAVVAWRGIGASSFYPSTDYAQRLTVNGYLGHVLPRVTAVQDVPNDEGGFVRVQIAAAGADALSPNDATFVTGYGLWRRIEQSSLAPQAALARADVTDRLVLTARMRQGPVRLGAAAAALVGMPPGSWESVGLFPAAGLASYSLLAPTRQDAVTGIAHREVFVVTAHTSTNGLVGLSFADSGSSVDNIPPVPPTALAGTFGGGALHLTWTASPATDLGVYAVYRGSSAGFVPGPGSLLGRIAGTGFPDATFVPGSYYKVTALDRHGNESAAAALSPAQTTGVDAGGAVLAFAPPVPNPARGTTALAFTLPASARVRITLFDVGGRQVRVLADGWRPAGTHELAWDLRDGAGRAVGAGLYFARFESAGQVLRRRIVVAG